MGGRRMQRTRCGLAALATVVGLWGCGSGSDGGQAQRLVEQLIGPAGGEVRSADGRLSVTVPPDALDQETTLFIRRLDVDELPADFQGMDADAAYDLGPDGLSFEPPLQLSLSLDTDQVSVADPITVPLVRLVTEGAGAPEPLLDQQITGDSRNGRVTVTGKLGHFSTVVALGLREGERGLVSVTGVPGVLEVGETADLQVEVLVPAALDLAGVEYEDNSSAPIAFEPPQGPPFLAPVPFDRLLDATASATELWATTFTYRCAAAGSDRWGAFVRMDTLVGNRFAVSLPGFDSEPVEVDCVDPAGGDAGGAGPLFDAGVTAPEGMALLPNPWAGFGFPGACPFVLVVAGLGGMAVLDPCELRLLTDLPAPDGTGGLRGVTPLQPVEDLNGQTAFWLLGFGDSGWYLQELFADFGGGVVPRQVRPADGPFQGATTAANPAGDNDDSDGGAGSTLVVEASAGRVGLERFDLFAAGSYNGFFTEDEEIADFTEGDFPGAEGAPVTGELAQDGALALVVTQGPAPDQPGALYSFRRSPLTGDFLQGQLQGNVGADPRDLLGRTNPDPAAGEGVLAGVVLNFGSDSLTPFAVLDDGSVVLQPAVPAGDGPVNGDVRITADDRIESVNTGFNDASIYLARYDWNANVLAGAFGSAPEGCLNPGDIRFDLDDPDRAYVSCNGSDNLAVADLAAIRLGF